MDYNVQQGRTKAIISYFWWIGLLIAFLMNNNNYNSYAAFHIRQSIGLALLLLVISFITKFAWGIGGSILFLGWFVLWLIGLLSAIKGEEKPIPLLGEQFQQWFRNI
ncbi:hypothetical protein KH5_20980 [Urechidicola sp. KH5]